MNILRNKKVLFIQKALGNFLVYMLIKYSERKTIKNCYIVLVAPTENQEDEQRGVTIDEIFLEASKPIGY